MSTECHVYARCSGSPTKYPATDGQHLTTEFSGTRHECDKFVETRRRNNRPTHFLFISSLDIDAATRRHL